MGLIALLGAVAAFLWLPARADEQEEQVDLRAEEEAMAYTVAAEAGVLADVRLVEVNPCPE